MADSDEPDGPAEHGPLRSFGRRRGRKLSPRQTTLLERGLARTALDLESAAPVPLTDAFGAGVSEVWLEIGFGGGEHLLWQARHNPEVGLIGCEPFIDGVVKVFDGAERDGLTNIRVHADDARDVLSWLPSASISRAFVLFPDPWPKKRHIKRRLVRPQLLAELASVVKPGGELRLATDIPDYAAGMLAAVRQDKSFRWLARQPKDWRIRPDDWPATRYEQKAIREGRRCYFLCFKHME